MADSSNEALLTLILARATDPQAILDLLAQHPASTGADACAKAQRELYWKRKDILATIAVSVAGIEHGVTSAKRAADENETSALRDSARVLAYNLASFTWPGWDEPGIVLTPANIAAGLEAARVCLQLTERLDRPAREQANAHWALGAQLLAAGDPQAAIASFESGRQHAHRAEDGALVRMFEGYLALAQVLIEPESTGAQTTFESVVGELRADPSDDAQEFARQLPIALAVFQRA